MPQIQGFWPTVLALVSLYVLMTVSGIIGLRAWFQKRVDLVMVAFSMMVLGWATSPIIYRLNAQAQVGMSSWQVLGFSMLTILLWAIGTTFVLLVYFQIEYMVRHWREKLSQVLNR